MPVYLVKDAIGRKVEGKFYENELSLVRGLDQKEYKIEQYIKERGNKVLVRWLGYGPEFDSWINKSDVKDYE